MERRVVGRSSEAIGAFREHPRFFYGWVIAVVSGLGLASGVSVFLPSTIGLLIGPLGREFGWTPPQVLTALTFATLATLFAAPVTGRIVDAVGPRRVIVVALLLEAVLIASFAFVTAGIAGLYVRYLLLAALATGTTAISYSALISRWFDRHRGLALGVALAGVGFGGVVWSILTQYLFDLVGWRAAMLYLGGGLAAVVLPVQLAFVRDDPTDRGLAKDGDIGPSVGGSETGAAIDGLTLSEAMRQGRFWLVLAIFFLTTFATYGVMLNLVTILIGQGSTPRAAAAVQASIWLAILLGRVFTGWCLDRFFAPRVALAFALPAIVGTVALALGASGGTAVVAAMMIGLAAGAEIDVLAYLVGRYFGLRHFGVIYSINFGAVAVATSLGPVAVASIAQANGGAYGPAMAALAASLALACVLLLFLPRLPERFAAR